MSKYMMLNYSRMIKNNTTLKRTISVLVVSFFLLAFCGCTQKVSDEFGGGDLERYQEYFAKFNTYPSNAEIASSADMIYRENWNEKYFLLMVEFMSGGFTTTQNLDYYNKQYPREYYEYSLQDLNDDGIPEFLLSYRYNGVDQTFWEIYSANVNDEKKLVGTIMYYNPQKNLIFDGYKESYVTVYEIINDKLVEKCSYYENYDEYICDEGDDEAQSENISSEGDENKDEYTVQYCFKDENGKIELLSEDEYKEKIEVFFEGNIKIKGKRLSVENLAEDLGVDISQAELKEKAAYRTYYGLLKYYSRIASDMTDYSYAFIKIDEDNIPELIALKDNKIKVFLYKNGEINVLSGEAERRGTRSECIFFPQKSVFESYSASYGCIDETYFFVSSEKQEVQEILKIEQMPIDSTFGNDYERNGNGKIRNHYYIDGRIATENDCSVVRGLLYDTLGLEKTISVSDLDTKTFYEMLEEISLH